MPGDHAHGENSTVVSKSRHGSVPAQRVVCICRTGTWPHGHLNKVSAERDGAGQRTSDGVSAGSLNGFGSLLEGGDLLRAHDAAAAAEVREGSQVEVKGSDLISLASPRDLLSISGANELH